MTQPELRALTGVRGLFAWVVVLYHLRFACPWLPGWAAAPIAKGYLAVDFFFMLSGFVIWLNYGEALAGGASIRTFLLRRLARIWPLHATMLGGCMAIALLLIATGRPAPRYPFADLPAHLLLVQDWGPFDPLRWNDPAWSISAEWAAYLTLPLAAMALPRRTPSLAALVAGAIVPLVLLALAMDFWGTTTLDGDIGRWGVPRCLCEFASGAALSAIWKRTRGGGGALAAAVTLAIAAGIGWSAGVRETLAGPATFAAALLALALTEEGSHNPLGRPLPHRLGEISYATYLVHMPAIVAFKLAVVRDATNIPPYQIVVLLTLILVASIVLHDHIERPAQRRLLAQWAERRTPRPLPLRPPRSTL